MGINGQVIVNRYGGHRGKRRDHRPHLYAESLRRYPFPVYQWVDDVEIWNGFPPVGNNPPYAPH